MLNDDTNKQNYKNKTRPAEKKNGTKIEWSAIISKWHTIVKFVSQIVYFSGIAFLMMHNNVKHVTVSKWESIL